MAWLTSEKVAARMTPETAAAVVEVIISAG
jgi:hypothetical protein